jgi:hypothetical protein
MVERIDIGSEELQQLLERARERLSEEDYRKLKAAVDTLEYLTELVADKDTTIRQLRQLLLPASTEKTKDVLARAGVEATSGRAERKPEGPSSPKIRHRATDATAPRPSPEPAKCQYPTPS